MSYAKTPSRYVHALENIHPLIGGVQLGIIVLFVGLAWGYFEFFTNAAYFTVGLPFLLLGTEVHAIEPYLLANAAIVVSRILNTLCSEIIDDFMSNTSAECAKYTERMFGTVFRGRMIVSIMHAFLRRLNGIIGIYFIYSQFTFWIVMAATDIATNLVLLGIRLDYIQKLRDKVGAHVPFAGWYRAVRPAMLVQLLFLPGEILLLYFCRAGKSGFFRVGPPMFVFQAEITTTWLFAVFSVVLFLDQLSSTALSERMREWILYAVQNNAVISEEEMNSKEWETYVVIFVSTAVGWLRTVILLNVWFAQLFFPVLYAVAESAVIGYQQYQRLTREAKFRKDHLHYILWMLLGEVVELSLIVGLFFVERPFDATYFHFGPPLLIFETMLTTHTHFFWLAFLISVLRIGYALYEGVVEPYNTHGIRCYDTHEAYYSRDVTMFFMSTSMVYTWVVRLTSVQLAFASIEFNIIEAVVDIIMHLIIAYFYMRHKRRERKRVLRHTTTKQATGAYVAACKEEVDLHMMMFFRVAGQEPSLEMYKM